MIGARPIFKLLRESDNPATDDALLAALKGTDAPTADAVIDTLLERHTTTGIHGLIAIFHELDEPVRQRILASTDHIFRALREALQSKHEQVRLNVIDVIRRGRLYRASYLLDAALHDAASLIRQTAAETIYFLAEAMLAESESPEADDLTPEQIQQRMIELDGRAEDRRQLVASIASGLTGFNMHHQPRVVEAAMWLVDDLGRKLWTALSAAGGKALRVAITVFDGSKDPRLIPFAITAMNHTDFRPHVVKMLASCHDPDFMAEWFRQCWRMSEPKTAKSMMMLKDLGIAHDRGAGLMQFPVDAQRHIGRWLTATSATTETKIFLMKELYRRGDPLARPSALWNLLSLRDEQVTSLLQVIAGDNTDGSRVALYELAQRRPERYPPKDLLAPSRSRLPGGTLPTDPARQAGPTDPADMTFDDYWGAFDDMNEPDRLKLGKEMLAHAPSAGAALKRLLEDQDPSGRMRALRIISTLGLLETFADPLYALSHDPQPSVRSAAVLALGGLDNSTSRLILHNALLDPDSRVQANAVEAIDRLEGSFDSRKLMPKLDSPDNRVRANAVKALLKMGVREAAESLLKMLADENRAQRISALWLIDQMGLFTLAQRVVTLASGDEDAQVRARAKLLASRLLDETQKNCELRIADCEFPIAPASRHHPQSEIRNSVPSTAQSSAEVKPSKA